MIHRGQTWAASARNTSPLVLFVRRAASFGMVGGFVALTGIALQYALVQYAGFDKHLAYFIQSIVSIELNFFINNFVTWRDRRRRAGLLRRGRSSIWSVFLPSR